MKNHNIDGELIDLEQDDLASKLVFETATFRRRFMAYLIDIVLVISICFIGIAIFKVFKDIDHFMEVFEATDSDLTDILKYKELRDLFWKLMFNIYLIWLGSNLLYFTLVPAIIGDGRTIGKMLAGIGVVDLATLEEISPSRLMLREFIGRTLIENVLIIPFIVSIIISFVREDSRSLHDLIAKTVVIRFDLYKLE